MNRIIRRALNRIRVMDGKRAMTGTVWVLAALLLLVVFLGGGESGAANLTGEAGQAALNGLMEESSALEEQTNGETEPQTTETETLAVGIIMYVKLEEYGSSLPYFDAQGNELGQFEQGDEVEVLSVEGDQAVIYYNEDYDIGYTQAKYLAEERPGRLTRPAVQPTLSPEEAGKVSIHIYKERRELELLSNGEVIAVYSVGLGGWPWDTKIAKGDSRTPEGSYYICVRNANSRFHLSLGLSYPNKEDAQRGYENGVITKKQKNAIDKAIDAGEQPPWNTGLGGEIMIHGASEDGIGAEFDWTAGCIAVDDAVIDILWEYCRLGTEVIIDP